MAGMWACYHPLFLFNQFGDLEPCLLRPGEVHSAEGWRVVLAPVPGADGADRPFAHPTGGPPAEAPQIFFASFSYQAQSWSKPRRVWPRREWHRGELYPRVGFLVTT